ncbi:hypothetical protein [Bacillus amyloliquefaciens]|uniref:hypothetical protein n=1 Tax=Bacillus subtilis group TaxID=653685 RepID=UPI0005EEBC54|nr:hypothetical protein [Bacillus amyloliquefaciens]
MSNEIKDLQLLIQQQMQGLYQYLDLKFSEIEKEFKAVNEKLDRIEAGQPEDFTAVLDRIKKNTDVINQDIEHLAGKVGKHDMILDRLTKQ